jgi:signal transduction histidine kinase
MPPAGALARAGQVSHLVGASPGAVGWWVAAAMAAVAVLALALLRRRPFTALALLLAGSLAAMGAPGRWFVAFALVLPAVLLLAGVAVCFIAATRPVRASLTAAVVALGVLAGGWAVWPGVRLAPTFFLGASPELAVALIMIIAWLAGHSIRQAHTHAETLRAQAEAQAATAQRLAIARDLHDQVAHAIGIIAIQAGAGARVIDTQPAEARNALAAIEATSRHTLAGLRQTVRALRQAGTHPSPPPAAPGLAGLGQLAAATRDAGVHVEVHWPGQRRPLPADVDTCAFRIIQEAVTNVVRHAGTPSCRVSIDQREDELAIEVTDDGRGSTIAGSGYGIAGMRERAALLHGKLTAGPRPEGGFRVAARLPVPAAAR